MLSENYVGYNRPLYSQPLPEDTSQYSAFNSFLNDERLEWQKQKREDSRSPYQRKAANERERKRMHSINKGFDCLRERLPIPRYAHSKKLSKVETLKNAIDYICYLSGMLERNFNESDVIEPKKPQQSNVNVVLKDPRTTSLQTSDSDIGPCTVTINWRNTRDLYSQQFLSQSDQKFAVANSTWIPPEQNPRIN